MVAAYLRYSTSSQDEAQQMHALREWEEKNGISIDVIEKDEGISGGISYKDRNLYRLVKKMKAGDALIVTEISRLGRSMSNISEFLNKELKPRKVRIVITKMGIDVDCSQMKAQDEFLFSALLFAAQIEKEMIQQRTQSALDARKELLKTEGGFFSKNGNWTTHLGRAKGHDMPEARRVACMARTQQAHSWRIDSPLYIWVENQVYKGRPRKDILAEALELYEKNPDKYCTREGKALCKGTLSRWVREIQKS